MRVTDGDPVPARVMVAALTAAELAYPDGSTQRFDASGETTYVQNGGATRGDWQVLADGRFWSGWPPSYQAIYDIAWLAERGRPVGLVFTDGRGSRFEGRYR